MASLWSPFPNELQRGQPSILSESKPGINMIYSNEETHSFLPHPFIAVTVPYCPPIARALNMAQASWHVFVPELPTWGCLAETKTHKRDVPSMFPACRGALRISTDCWEWDSRASSSTNSRRAMKIGGVFVWHIPQGILSRERPCSLLTFGLTGSPSTVPENEWRVPACAFGDA